VADYLLLAQPSDEGTPHVLRVTVPKGLSREDVYLLVMSHLPAGAPQPVPLNMDRASVG